MFEGSDFIWFVQMFFVFLSEIPDFWVLQDIVKLPASFATTIGDLWDICGLSVAFYKRVSIIMLQKTSARKGFCAES